jgi:hypothetical protein
MFALVAHTGVAVDGFRIRGTGGQSAARESSGVSNLCVMDRAAILAPVGAR